MMMIMIMIMVLDNAIALSQIPSGRPLESSVDSRAS